MTPLVVAIVAFGGGLLVADLTIEGQKEQALEDFQRDQRQQHYSEILQQATRLHNAGDASTSALSAGLYASLAGIAGGLDQLGDAAGKAGPRLPLDKRSQLEEPGSNSGLGPNSSYYNSYGDYYKNTYAQGSSWQDAYTALDQAISNAEIASDDGVIALARALRDKYRLDYHQSVMKNIDEIIAAYPDPKPEREKLADALVGVPADRSPRTYEPGLLTKSTDELTAMYADAAKENLGIVDEPSSSTVTQR